MKQLSLLALSFASLLCSMSLRASATSLQRMYVEPEFLDVRCDRLLPANALVTASDARNNPLIESAGTRANIEFAHPHGEPWGWNLVKGEGEKVTLSCGKVTLGKEDRDPPKLQGRLEVEWPTVTLKLVSNPDYEHVAYVAWYAAPTEAELAALSTTTMLTYVESRPDVKAAIMRYPTFASGKRVDRQCVAAAFVDLAGNIGRRTNVVCVDTPDEDLQQEKSVAGISCAFSPTRSEGTPAVLASLGLLMLVRRGRRARS